MVQQGTTTSILNNFDNLKNFGAIHDYIKEHNKIYVFFDESKHKIKKKAEQTACKNAIQRVKANK